jgi:hypothetical protein
MKLFNQGPGPDAVLSQREEDREEMNAHDPDAIHPTVDEEVLVDPHVMATPALVDVTGDGFPELIVPVSYYFDEDEYMNNANLFRDLPIDIDIKKYVAGGIVVYDLRNHHILWSQTLDLSTATADSQAHVYSSPTLVDLDGDG